MLILIDKSWCENFKTIKKNKKKNSGDDVFITVRGNKCKKKKKNWRLNKYQSVLSNSEYK